ncbi:MAG: hypothetical protein JJE46_09070 [Acidimicrobiia bacterium]|nr:hypothetical protein [Acidimicrobiia bacterium]
MSLLLRKGVAYVSSLFLASLAARTVYAFVQNRIFDGSMGWFVLPVSVLLSVAWVYLAAFLYSRLAPLDLVRQWEAERTVRSASRP